MNTSRDARMHWTMLDASRVAGILSDVRVRWWLSGGVALDRWLGRDIRPRESADVSVIAADLPDLVAKLPDTFSAWVEVGEESMLVPFAEISRDEDVHSVLVHDDTSDEWVLTVNSEDGGPGAWMYKRDPRLQVPWDRAVVDLDGIPTGTPEIQLLWKALRPRPEDDVDKDAVFGSLSEEARGWFERAILTIHPHSTWSIHVRSPFAPAKASWNRRSVR